MQIIPLYKYITGFCSIIIAAKMLMCTALEASIPASPSSSHYSSLSDRHIVQHSGICDLGMTIHIWRKKNEEGRCAKCGIWYDMVFWTILHGQTEMWKDEKKKKYSSLFSSNEMGDPFFCAVYSFQLHTHLQILLRTYSYSPIKMIV